MKTLTLIRHAKSCWDNPYLDDLERPLNPRGQHDLPRMAERLRQHINRPDLLLFSPALRTRLTAQSVADALQLSTAQCMENTHIHEASLEGLIQVLQAQPDACTHVMLVGHNPGLSLLGTLLAPDEAPTHFPTCAVQQLQLNIEHWTCLRQGCGHLHWFDYPKLYKTDSK